MSKPENKLLTKEEIDEAYEHNCLYHKEVLATDDEIADEIRFEDNCGVNTLLQNLLSPYIKDRAFVYKCINEKGEWCGYKIRDKLTGEDIQL